MLKITVESTAAKSLPLLALTMAEGTGCDYLS